MIETQLVAILMSGGMTHFRAVMVERICDDYGQGNVTSDAVVRALEAAMDRRVRKLQDELEECKGMLAMYREAELNRFADAQAELKAAPNRSPAE